VRFRHKLAYALAARPLSEWAASPSKVEPDMRSARFVGHCANCGRALMEDKTGLCALYGGRIDTQKTYRCGFFRRRHKVKE